MPLFAACWKPVELRASVDPLDGTVREDPLSLGVSAADEAALEWALRCRERVGGTVRAVAAGDSRANAVLRTAAAAGADELVWVETDPGWPSEWVAHALASQLAGADLVWCGDVSADRGSGSVPAFVAAELGVGQALGLTGIAFRGDDAAAAGAPAESVEIEVLRRLDGGRREQLVVRSATVLSTEGGTARLRRAGLDPTLTARTAEIVHVRGERGPSSAPQLVSVGPFRPPARAVAPPEGADAGQRIRSLVGLSSQSHTARAIRLEPAQAAEAILAALEEWGEYP